MKKFLLLTFTCLAINAQAAEPIVIGDVAAYTEGASFTQPYKHGVDMAVEEINKAGGVLGRPLKVITRDSKGNNPGEAVRIAEEMVNRDHVDMLMSCDFSTAALAVSNFALQNHMPLLINCSEGDSTVWGQGNAVAFRTTPGAYMWVAASMNKAVDAYGDKLKGKRWVTIAQNFEFGHSLVDAAKKIAADKKLDPQWAGEQWPAYDQLDAGAAITALERAKPDVVFCPLWDKDLAKFIREAKKRGFLKNRIFIAPALALPENAEMVGKEMPEGWVSVGMPAEEITLPGFQDYLKKYRASTKEPFRTYTLSGYGGVKAAAAAFAKAKSTDKAAVIKALSGIQYDTPIGKMTIRSLDHQATVPVWTGLTKFENGKAKLTDWTMYQAKDILPDDAWVKTQRKAK